MNCREKIVSKREWNKPRWDAWAPVHLKGWSEFLSSFTLTIYLASSGTRNLNAWCFLGHCIPEHHCWRKTHCLLCSPLAFFKKILLNKLVTYGFHKSDTKLKRRLKSGYPNCSLHENSVWLGKMCPSHGMKRFSYHLAPEQTVIL